jgi:hypothetical protein
VDDILIVYKDNTTNIEKVLSSFNNINPELTFTVEQEKDNKLNFLDITVTKDANKLTYEIYRKPTTSHTIIPKDSCHPIEHKLAAVRYFANRIHTYNLDQTQKQKETDTVKEILHNNKYSMSLLSKVHNRRKHKMGKIHLRRERNKVYYKTVINTHLKVAYTTNNSLGKLLDTQKTEKLNKFEKNGVYQLKCPRCQKKYVGQTGRPCHVRFREHYRD